MELWMTHPSLTSQKTSQARVSSPPTARMNWTAWLSASVSSGEGEQSESLLLRWEKSENINTHTHTVSFDLASLRRDVTLDRKFLLSLWVGSSKYNDPVLMAVLSPPIHRPLECRDALRRSSLWRWPLPVRDWSSSRAARYRTANRLNRRRAISWCLYRDSGWWEGKEKLTLAVYNRQNVNLPVPERSRQSLEWSDREKGRDEQEFSN